MEIGFRCTTLSSGLATEYGHLELVKWLCAINCPLRKFASNIAAYNGHLNIYKWLSKNITVRRSTWESAIQGGHLEVINFIFSQSQIYLSPGCTLSCTIAAKLGYLDVLQWLRKNGFPWDMTTSAAAAYGCHLEVLQWLRENGCPTLG